MTLRPEEELRNGSCSLCECFSYILIQLVSIFRFLPLAFWNCLVGSCMVQPIYSGPTYFSTIDGINTTFVMYPVDMLAGSRMTYQMMIVQIMYVS